MKLFLRDGFVVGVFSGSRGIGATLGKDCLDRGRGR